MLVISNADHARCEDVNGLLFHFWIRVAGTHSPLAPRNPVSCYDAARPAAWCMVNVQQGGTPAATNDRLCNASPVGSPRPVRWRCLRTPGERSRGATTVGWPPLPWSWQGEMGKSRGAHPGDVVLHMEATWISGVVSSRLSSDIRMYRRWILT